MHLYKIQKSIDFYGINSTKTMTFLEFNTELGYFEDSEDSESSEDSEDSENSENSESSENILKYRLGCGGGEDALAEEFVGAQTLKCFL